MGFDGVLTCTVAMMGSFGPVAALSSLSSNPNQALASRERVLSLLEEAPVVEEIPGEEPGNAHAFSEAEAKNVRFASDNGEILEDYSVKIQSGKIAGIHRGQRLRKIHPSEAADALLGCFPGQRIRRWQGCKDHSHQVPAGYGELCDPADPPVP